MNCDPIFDVLHSGIRHFLCDAGQRGQSLDLKIRTSNHYSLFYTLPSATPKKSPFDNPS